MIIVVRICLMKLGLYVIDHLAMPVGSHFWCHWVRHTRPVSVGLDPVCYQSSLFMLMTFQEVNSIYGQSYKYALKR